MRENIIIVLLVVFVLFGSFISWVSFFSGGYEKYVTVCVGTFQDTELENGDHARLLVTDFNNACKGSNKWNIHLYKVN